MLRYDSKTDGKKIMNEFMFKVRLDKYIRLNYKFVQKQAYECIQQIMQHTLFNKDVTSLMNDFNSIVEYYNEKILNHFNNNKLYLYNYSLKMFYSLLLFPNNDYYLKIKDDKQMMLGISDDIIKARNDFMHIEKTMFKYPCENLFNDKLQGFLKDKNFLNAVNEFQFNLIKLMLTKDLNLCSEEFNSGNTIEIVNNYEKKVDKNIAPVLKFMLGYYHENKDYKYTVKNLNNIKKLK